MDYANVSNPSGTQRRTVVRAPDQITDQLANVIAERSDSVIAGRSTRKGLCRHTYPDTRKVEQFDFIDVDDVVPLATTLVRGNCRQCRPRSLVHYPRNST